MKQLKSVIKLEKRIDELKAKHQSELERRSALLEDLRTKHEELLKQQDQAMLDGNLELYQATTKALDENQSSIDMMVKSIEALDNRELISVEEYIQANEEIQKEYDAYADTLKKKIREAYKIVAPIFEEEDDLHEHMNEVLKKWQKDCLRSKDNPKRNANGGVSVFSRSDNENTDFTIFYSLKDFIRSKSTERIVNGE